MEVINLSLELARKTKLLDIKLQQLRKLSSVASENMKIIDACNKLVGPMKDLPIMIERSGYFLSKQAVWLKVMELHTKLTAFNNHTDEPLIVRAVLASDLQSREELWETIKRSLEPTAKEVAASPFSGHSWEPSVKLNNLMEKFREQCSAVYSAVTRELMSAIEGSQIPDNDTDLHTLSTNLQMHLEVGQSHFDRNKWSEWPFAELKSYFLDLTAKRDAFNKSLRASYARAQQRATERVNEYSAVVSVYNTLLGTLTARYKEIGVDIPKDPLPEVTEHTDDEEFQANLAHVTASLDLLKKYDISLTDLVGLRSQISEGRRKIPWALGPNEFNVTPTHLHQIQLGNLQSVIDFMSNKLEIVREGARVNDEYNKQTQLAKNTATEVNKTIKRLNFTYGAKLEPTTSAPENSFEPTNLQNAKELLSNQSTTLSELRKTLENYKYIETRLKNSPDILQNLIDVQKLTGDMKSDMAREIIEESFTQTRKGTENPASLRIQLMLALRELAGLEVVDVHPIPDNYKHQSKVIQKLLDSFEVIQIDPNVYIYDEKTKQSAPEPIFPAIPSLNVDYSNKELTNHIVQAKERIIRQIYFAKILRGFVAFYNFKKFKAKEMKETTEGAKLVVLTDEQWKHISRSGVNLNPKVMKAFIEKAQQLTRQIKDINKNTYKLNMCLYDLQQYEKNMKTLTDTNNRLVRILQIRESEKPTDDNPAGTTQLKEASLKAASLQPVLLMLCSQIAVDQSVFLKDMGRGEFMMFVVKTTEFHFKKHIAVVGKVKPDETPVFDKQFEDLQTNVRKHAKDGMEYVLFIDCLNKFVNGYLELFDSMYNVRIMINNRTAWPKDKRKETNAKANFALLYNTDTDKSLATREMAIACVKRGRNNQCDKPFGPFYKVIYGGQGIDVTYDVEIVKKEFEAAERNLAAFKPRHYIYSAYGYSGSGKTYTLLSAENEKSILNTLTEEIGTFAKFKKLSVSVRYYDLYGELDDKLCIGTEYIRDKERIEETAFYEENGSKITDGQDMWYKYQGGLSKDDDPDDELRHTDRFHTEIMSACASITQARVKNDAGKGEPCKHHIRCTPNNDQSSRSHFFIDIVVGFADYTLAKFTILDMGGSENVQQIQDMYFDRTPIKAYQVTQVPKKVWSTEPAIKNGFSDMLSASGQQRVRDMYSKLGLEIKQSSSVSALLEYKPWHDLREHYQTRLVDEQSVADITTLLKWNNLAAIALAVHEAHHGRLAIESLFIKLFLLDEKSTTKANDILSLTSGDVVKTRLQDNTYNVVNKDKKDEDRVKKGSKSNPALNFVNEMPASLANDIFNFIKDIVDNYKAIKENLDELNGLWKKHEPGITRSFPIDKDGSHALTSMDPMDPREKELLQKIAINDRKEKELYIRVITATNPDTNILKDQHIPNLKKKIQANNDLIRKHHCPLRNQGRYINTTLDDIEKWTPTLDEPAPEPGAPVPTYKTNMIKLLTCVGDRVFGAPGVVRKFVLFNNVRLDYAVGDMEKSKDKDTRESENEYMAALDTTLDFADRVNPFSEKSIRARAAR